MFALRAGIPEDVPVDGDRWRIGRDAPVVTSHVAVGELAAMPKPVQCYIEVDAGVIELVASPAPRAWTPHHRRTLPRPYNTDLWLEDRYGTGYRESTVLCVWRDEWLIVTFGELEEWDETYFCFNTGYGGNPLESAEVPADALQEVQRRGVVHVNTFGPNRGPQNAYDRVYITKLAPGSTSPMCSGCGKRPTVYTVWQYESNTPQKDLCQRCVDDLMTVPQFDRGRELTRLQAELAALQRTAPIEVLNERAEEQAMRWALQWKPPFVREFIQTYRR